MDKLARLEQVLLRAHTIVEEAEGKQISNQGMILQLRQLRKNMYRGYYVLDTYKRRGAAVSTYLFMERCMFGRHSEKEQIINFLLQTCDSSLRVLPIVGPPEIGKRTLVEHVYKEEMVRKQFSQIVHINSNGMNQLVTDVHGSSELVVSDARSLIVVDLGHDGDDAAWRRIRSLICQTYGDKSRVLLISTAEEVSRLGTTQALRMKKLHRDEYWYYFKTIAFGSANPDDHHQLLPSIAKKIVTHIDGSLIAANVIARLLQADLSEAFWRYVSEYVKKTTHYRHLVHGGCAQDRIREGRPFYLGNHVYGPLLLCYQCHETAGPLMESELPKIKGADLITRGSTIPREGKLEVLRWQSTIPPYRSYIASCDVQDPQQVMMPKEKHLKRKRHV
ncbi:putative disease resistance protein RGA4 [Miscanthus floridulus]|uniref:putative disease resistance protein RGA4 n=1 Tax=Miscanthus floridulus TaxID=154761 RepID=UPI00345760D3